MKNKKYDKNNIIIVFLLIIIVVLCIFLFVLIKDKILLPKNDTEIVDNGKAVIDNNSNEITKEEALKIGKELYDYADKAYFGDKEVWPSHFVDNENGPGQTKVCDTTAEEVKKKFSKDFQFEQFFDDNKEANYSGNLDEFINSTAASQCGGVNRGTLQNYLNSEINDPTIGENRITFKATSNYCSSSFCHDGKEVDHSIVKKFEIVKINDEWFIEYYAITR